MRSLRSLIFWTVREDIDFSAAGCWTGRIELLLRTVNFKCSNSTGGGSSFQDTYPSSQIFFTTERPRARALQQWQMLDGRRLKQSKLEVLLQERFLKNTSLEVFLLLNKKYRKIGNRSFFYARSRDSNLSGKFVPRISQGVERETDTEKKLQ